MRVFKLKSFSRFCRRADIDDAMLSAAVRDIEAGLIDANLGGGVIKQRVARKGSGKSGGFRTIVVAKIGQRALFVKGFAKKDIDNIGDRELADLKRLAAIALELEKSAVATLLRDGDWIEVRDDVQV